MKRDFPILLLISALFSLSSCAGISSSIQSDPDKEMISSRLENSVEEKGSSEEKEASSSDFDPFDSAKESVDQGDSDFFEPIEEDSLDSASMDNPTPWGEDIYALFLTYLGGNILPYFAFEEESFDFILDDDLKNNGFYYLCLHDSSKTDLLSAADYYLLLEENTQGKYDDEDSGLTVYYVFDAFGAFYIDAYYEEGDFIEAYYYPYGDIDIGYDGSKWGTDLAKQMEAILGLVLPHTPLEVETFGYQCFEEDEDSYGSIAIYDESSANLLLDYPALLLEAGFFYLPFDDAYIYGKIGEKGYVEVYLSFGQYGLGNYIDAYFISDENCPELEESEVVEEGLVLSFADETYLVEKGNRESRWEIEGYSFEVEQNTSTVYVGNSSPGKSYYSNPLRLYEGQKVTVSWAKEAPRKVAFFVNTSSTKSKAANLCGEEETIGASYSFVAANSSVVFEVGEGESEFSTVIHGGQVHLDKIVFAF